MEDSPRKRLSPKRPREEFTFEVTCVIGEVTVGPYGSDIPPHVAAMDLIARHDAEGIYHFPMADGRTQRVTIEFVPNPLDVSDAE